MIYSLRMFSQGLHPEAHLEPQVITEGAKGTEMAATYARLRELRGVEVGVGKWWPGWEGLVKTSRGLVKTRNIMKNIMKTS